jgi:cytosine permease
MITKLTFGSVGGKFVSGILALTLLGWFGVTAELFGRGVYKIASDFGWESIPLRFTRDWVAR